MRPPSGKVRRSVSKKPKKKSVNPTLAAYRPHMPMKVLQPATPAGHYKSFNTIKSTATQKKKKKSKTKSQKKIASAMQLQAQE